MQASKELELPKHLQEISTIGYAILDFLKDENTENTFLEIYNSAKKAYEDPKQNLLGGFIYEKTRRRTPEIEKTMREFDANLPLGKLIAFAELTCEGTWYKGSFNTHLLKRIFDQVKKQADDMVLGKPGSEEIFQQIMEINKQVQNINERVKIIDDCGKWNASTEFKSERQGLVTKKQILSKQKIEMEDLLVKVSLSELFKRYTYKDKSFFQNLVDLLKITMVKYRFTYKQRLESQRVPKKLAHADLDFIKFFSDKNSAIETAVNQADFIVFHFDSKGYDQNLKGYKWQIEWIDSEGKSLAITQGKELIDLLKKYNDISKFKNNHEIKNQCLISFKNKLENIQVEMDPEAEINFTSTFLLKRSGPYKYVIELSHFDRFGEEKTIDLGNHTCLRDWLYAQGDKEWNEVMELKLKSLLHTVDVVKTWEDKNNFREELSQKLGNTLFAPKPEKIPVLRFNKTEGEKEGLGPLISSQDRQEAKERLERLFSGKSADKNNFFAQPSASSVPLFRPAGPGL